MKITILFFLLLCLTCASKAQYGDHDSIDIAYNLGFGIIDPNQKNQAEDIYKALVKAHPSNYYYWLRFAEFYKDREYNYRRALRIYKYILKHDTLSMDTLESRFVSCNITIETYKGLVFTLQQTEHAHKALKACKEAIKKADKSGRSKRSDKYYLYTQELNMERWMHRYKDTAAIKDSINIYAPPPSHYGRDINGIAQVTGYGQSMNVVYNNYFPGTSESSPDRLIGLDYQMPVWKKFSIENQVYYGSYNSSKGMLFGMEAHYNFRYSAGLSYSIYTNVFPRWKGDISVQDIRLAIYTWATLQAKWLQIMNSNYWVYGGVLTQYLYHVSLNYDAKILENNGKSTFSNMFTVQYNPQHFFLHNLDIYLAYGRYPFLSENFGPEYQRPATFTIGLGTKFFFRKVLKWVDWSPVVAYEHIQDTPDNTHNCLFMGLSLSKYIY